MTTKRTFITCTAFITFSSFFFVSLANAQVVDISECRALEGNLARLACYEKLESESSTPTPTFTSTPTPSSASPEIIESAIVVSTTDRTETERSSTAEIIPVIQTEANLDDFGQDSEINEEAQELFSSIAELKRRSHNKWLITLENGQVWGQVVADRYDLHQGDDVKIYLSRWGSSYRLSKISLAGFIQVERIQ